MEGNYLPGFYGENNHVYTLDVEILKDASCLDAAHPRLQVFANGTDYTYLASILFWLCAVCAGTGVALLLIEWNRLYKKLPTPVRRAEQPGMARTSAGWKVRPKKALPFSRMPSFGYFAVNLLWILVAIMMIGRVLEFYGAYGLRVRILRPDLHGQSTPGMDPILVWMRLTGGNSNPDLYVNSQLVSWEAFGAALQNEINQRPPEWPVYFKGDPEMDWRWAGQAIDRIRGLQAQVVLLTPSGATLGKQFKSTPSR